MSAHSCGEGILRTGSAAASLTATKPTVPATHHHMSAAGAPRAAAGLPAGTALHRGRGCVRAVAAVSRKEFVDTQYVCEGRSGSEYNAGGPKGFAANQDV